MRKELIAFRDPKSPISEVFRTLRTNIQFMNTNKSLKTLVVTSTLPREGKSWVVSNLAITFAQAEKKVLLIDADMRKGRQYSMFGVSPRPGLANYLAECRDNAEMSDIGKYIQRTEVIGLDVMTAGNVPPNPSELLITPQMTNLLSKTSNYYDIVIVDAPPCELVTDAVILSRIVDSTIVVAAYKQTKKANLQKTVRSIRNVGGNILGVVLNKIPVNGKKYEKSYYYGSQMVSTPKRSDRITNSRDDIPERRVSKHSADSENKSTSNSSESLDQEKAENILKQVNEYLEQEKKNLEQSKGDK